RGWRFAAGDIAGAAAPAFDDTQRPWSSVSVPHTYAAREAEDGAAEGRQRVAWYRLHLPPLPDRSGRRFFLQFDAASAVAEVYVNGTRLGQHRGRSSAFRFDATEALG